MKSEIVFLGDSLTEWGPWEKLFPEKNIVNLGIAGNKTSDIYNRLNSVWNYSPGKLFLMCGINDLGDGLSVEEIAERYTLIVRSLHDILPETEFYILSVLPVALNEWGNSNLNNDKVDELNLRIQEISRIFQASYVDMSQLFKNEKGELKEKLSLDGLHLSNEGYKVWKSGIEKYIN
jgi:lysophospholipase L1-like esterase